MRISDQQRLSWGKTLRERLEAERSLHAIVGERIARMETLDAQLGEALSRVNQESSEESEALTSLTTASDETARKLRLVAIKLEQAHLEGSVAPDLYRTAMGAAFPQGSGVIGGTPADRYAAARRVTASLEQHGAIDPDGSLAAIVREAAGDLEAKNVAAKKEAAERHVAHESLGRARHAWDEGYLATKEIVTGLLRDAARLGDLRALFPDLA
jgi:hypothetical protein